MAQGLCYYRNTLIPNIIYCIFSYFARNVRLITKHIDKTVIKGSKMACGSDKRG